MPIEVHCPNPACARVHLVKNKYAGTRGKCPACESWMYVPKTALMPSLPEMSLPPAPASVPALDESPPWPRQVPLAVPVAHPPAPRTLVAEPPAIDDAMAPMDEAPIEEPLEEIAAEEVVVEESADNDQLAAMEEEAAVEGEIAALEDESEAVVDVPVEAAMDVDEEEPAPLPRKRGALAVAEDDEPIGKPARRSRKRPADLEAEWSETGLVTEEEDEPKAKKPTKHFSWLAVVLLILAILGLGAFIAAPWLPPPSMGEPSGSFVNLPKPKGISEDAAPIVAGAAGLVALFAVTSLLLSLVSRRMGVVTLVPLYLAVFGAAVLLLLSLTALQEHSKHFENVVKIVNENKAKGNPGDANPTFGVQHYALVGGAAAANFGLVFGGVFMHRRIWSKLLGFVVLSFLPTLVAVWILTNQGKHLGLDLKGLGIDLEDLFKQLNLPL